MDKIQPTMKIAFCGTQSSGKSTLVKYLSLIPAFNTFEIFTEKSKEIRDIGIPLNMDSTLIGQIHFMSHRALELLEPYFLSDRSIIDVMGYTKASSTMNYYEKEDFCKLASNLIKEYDHIFYVSPVGVEIEDNKVREISAEYRETIDFIILNLLRNYGYRIKNLHYIPKNLTVEQRAAFVLDKINIYNNKTQGKHE